MTLEKLASSANQLSDYLLNVRQGGENVLSWIYKTNDILKFISDVADNSNLLGLNAAIEAARAGEQGRGFAVVAEEIRKMAVNSAQSVNEIKTILQNVHNEAKFVVDTIMNTAELGEKQASSTEEIFASMQQLTASVSEIDKISKTL
jgi:methyl-accepting chemotaxis protein